MSKFRQIKRNLERKAAAELKAKQKLEREKRQNFIKANWITY